LNDRGEVVLNVRFTDTTTGVFKTRIPVAGDATQDGIVNPADFHALYANFGKVFAGGDRSRGDFNIDGKVDFVDFQILERHFGLAPPGVASGVSAADYAQISEFAAAVPEPGATALLSLAVGSWLSRRRRVRPSVG
jgi:hypothetical protein